jgi:maltooligosyltrehalose trehalohydrolase
MGEEFGETAPFHYFTSFGDPDLARAVSEGRKREFDEFAHPVAFVDPQVAETFEHSKLVWCRIEAAEHQFVLQFYKDLIALRKRWPCLNNGRKYLTRVSYDEHKQWLRMDRTDPSGCRAALLCNFSSEPVAFDFDTNGWHLALALPSQPSAPAHAPAYSALLYVRES